MYEYRIIKSFEGYWMLEQKDIKNSLWFTYATGSYDKCKREYDQIMARKAYIPLILTPPFPDTDPTATSKRKFFKWF